MHSYDLYAPTHLVFGENRIAELPKLVAGLGKKVLITYGGGSVRRMGLLDRVKELLAGYELHELSGIEPNPKIDSIRHGVEICRNESIDFVVAVGGGSVIDATKLIVAGACYEGDAWELVLHPERVKKSLPFVTVLTLSATGSEYDAPGVISNPETNEKLGFMNNHTFPMASIMDPTYTFSVPAHQTAAGAADIMSHTFEQYIVKDGNILTDAMCEAMLKTVITCTPKALANPNDYEARAQLMMVSSFGCSGHLAIGRSPSPWPCHGIEHEISAFHDITHGVGLAIITPHWMRYSLTEETAPRFAQYGERVFDLPHNDDPMLTAKAAIDKTAEFFASIGIASRLSEVGVTDEHFEEMADHVAKCWWPLTMAIRPIDRAGVIEILRNSL